jgi:hypothetical protein
LNLEWLTNSKISFQRKGSLSANGDAHTTAHAISLHTFNDPLAHLDRSEWASFYTVATTYTQIFFDAASVPRCDQHRRPIAYRLHGAATTWTAVADGIETTKHRVLEKCMVNMTPGVFTLEDFLRFITGDPPCPTRMMINNEARKRLTHNQTDLEGQARVGSRGATRTLKRYNMARIFEDDVACEGVRDHMLQILQLDLFLHHNQLASGIRGQDFAMVSVSESHLIRI